MEVKDILLFLKNCNEFISVSNRYIITAIIMVSVQVLPYVDSLAPAIKVKVEENVPTIRYYSRLMV